MENSSTKNIKSIIFRKFQIFSQKLMFLSSQDRTDNIISIYIVLEKLFFPET